ncbi:MAG: UvrD-helicase domain-containing protein [Sandaracinaceae bacterium]|nr:UvrD-helicase domain-containing protein [Sandaracinaceae bacterium]
MGAKLNPAQQAAVDHGEGPLLVLAGAGSGKTRVITQRIASLCERGVRPEAILAVSFTNKAAAEMGERMLPLVGRSRAEKLWLSTFHSFGVRFLREESKALGYPGRFVIFDQGDALGLVREIVKREGLADRKLDLYSVHARISLWKNRGLPPEKIPEIDFEYDAVARDVYPHYQAGLRSMCAVDFDDLVAAPAAILREREDIRERWQNRFRHMLVDEFQDTNAIQLELVKLLANARGNVTVVGDDDQSIYGWRGAEVGNILDFESHFKGAKIVKLETNYRSRSPILEVANEAIARSKRPRHEKVLRSAKGPGPKVRMCTLEEAEAEAKMVVHEIRKLAASGYDLGSMAVLYRSNLMARPIEEELRVNGVGYRLYGGTKLFDKKEIKDAAAYLRVVVHPEDELSLRRIVNYPARQIGDTTIQRITRYALAHDLTFIEALARADSIPDVPEAAQRGARDFLHAIAAARRGFAEGALTATARKLFVDVGLERLLTEDPGPVAKKRWGNIEYVLRSLTRFEEKSGKKSIAEFLNRLTLDMSAEAEKTGQRVTLSSLHASKGLEFDVVFFIGLNEGQLPHSRTLDPKVTEAAPTDVEEERRLFYVGVTRARELLYLCRARRRVMRGRATPLFPSRFLEGLPEDLVEHYDAGVDAPVEHDEAASLGKALLDQLRGG